MYKNQENWRFILPNPDDRQLWIYVPSPVQQQLRKVGANHTNYYYVSLPDYARNFPYPDNLTAFLELEEAGMDSLQKLVSFMEHFLVESDRNDGPKEAFGAAAKRCSSFCYSSTVSTIFPTFPPFSSKAWASFA